MRHILKCQSCGRYTIAEDCACGGKAVLPHPPKYSPDDKYSGYKRKAKEEDRKEKGII